MIHAPTKAFQEPNLDILRSVAVLAVFLAHGLQVSAGCKIGEHIVYGVETYALGNIGVLLFFVHTSLVLMQSLERTGTSLTGWPLIRHFYIRRAFRIYPLSLFVIFLCITLSIPPNALNVPYHWQGTGWLLSNVLLVQNINRVGDVSTPLWSLPYEVQMYLLLPMLFLLLRAGKSGARLTFIYIASIALGMFQPLFRYFPCFLAGVIAYRLLGIVRPFLPGWLWCPVLVGAVLAFVVIPHPGYSWPREIATCMTVGASIPLFRRNSGGIATAAAQIAKYSYGIYLCHTPAMWLLYRKLTIPDWQRPIGVMIVTGLAAVACYHTIEHPLIQMGTRLANRAPVRWRASAAVATS